MPKRQSVKQLVHIVLRMCQSAGEELGEERLAWKLGSDLRPRIMLLAIGSETTTLAEDCPPEALPSSVQLWLSSLHEVRLLL